MLHDSKRKDDAKQKAERGRSAFRAGNGSSTVVASSRNYYCDYCFVSKQPREIFTSHQMLDLSCPSMSIQERKLVEKRKNQMKIKTIARHSLQEEGKKLPDNRKAFMLKKPPDDEKASMLMKPPDVKKAKMPKDVNEVCDENDYFNEVQAGLPLIQKMMAMEADDNHEESKSDEEAIAEAYRNMKTSAFVPYRLEWRERR